MKYIKYLQIIFLRLIEFSLFNNKRKLKINELEFKKNIIKSEEYAPVFFLSTGRTGTDFFTKLLSISSKVKVFHSPSSLFCNAQSELIEQGKIAYEMYSKYGFNDERTNKLASQIVMTSREDLLYKTYLHDKLYIETNNRITFLAPAIKYIFPNAKFVHLYRHPGEFIRSGVRRNYYNSTNNIHELGRLEPLENTLYYKAWKDFENIEKIAWMWNETNDFIDNFLSTINKNDYFSFNFNKLDSLTVKELLSFLDIEDIDNKIINKSINKPTNIQKSGSFPKYEYWKEEDKQKIKKLCGELSLKFGYVL